MRQSRRDTSLLGIALAAAAGFGAGLVAGLVAGELLGDVNVQRMRHAVRRLGNESEQPRTPSEVERSVAEALTQDAITRGLHIRVRVIDDGLIELTGRVPVEDVRIRAGEIARQATGGDVVVNRILVRGGARA